MIAQRWESSTGSSNEYTYTYTYNEDGLPTSRTYTSDNGYSYTEEYDLSRFYNENGELNGKLDTSYTSQYGCVTVNKYDDQGRLIHQENGSLFCSTCGDSTTYTYDENGNVTNKTTQYGTGSSDYSSYSYTYNEDGKMTSYTSQYGTSGPNTTYYTYDENGYVSSVQNSYGSSYFTPEDQAYVNQWGTVSIPQSAQTGSFWW